jgi:subtilisin family serine protease
VLDTGLLSTWRAYFPADHIATEWARCFGGGGGEIGFVSSQPNKWERDQNSHGTHVTSSILGYWLGATPINGAAPNAVVIPVKVLNQNGSGWSSVIARGIVYVANLKAGPLADSPVVINMSLGGSVLDAVEKAAIDYAIEQGVIIVASAGNRGEAGMGYPGAYAPVISCAASGWIGEWVSGGSWWNAGNVPEGPNADDFYITDFSSRELDGQELDVAAPGSWVVGPYQVNGQLSYFYLGGTSMASPHVAGIAALMLEKDASLTQAEVEAILKSTAVPLPAGTRMITNPNGTQDEIEWGDDASGSGLVNTNAALAAIP